MRGRPMACASPMASMQPYCEDLALCGARASRGLRLSVGRASRELIRAFEVAFDHPEHFELLCVA